MTRDDWISAVLSTAWLIAQGIGLAAVLAMTESMVRL